MGSEMCIRDRDKEKQIIADLKRREQQEELEARKAAKAARKANKKK